MAQGERLAYENADVSDDVVRAALDEFFSSLAADASLREAVRECDGDPEQLQNDRDAVTVSSEGAGFGAETVILIGIAQHVGTRLWDKVIEPWLVDRLGRGSLGTRRTPE